MFVDLNIFLLGLFKNLTKTPNAGKVPASDTLTLFDKNITLLTIYFDDLI